MAYKLNRTDVYHRLGIASLGWELTVCNTLENPLSPARKILLKNASYGEQLFSFLSNHIDWQSVYHILEVGGGYGFLMHALLEKMPSQRVTMLDISPFLLDRQKTVLAALSVEYIEMDFLDYEFGGNASPDLIIFNENLGDFPTLIALSREEWEGLPKGEEGSALVQAQRIINAYNLPPPLTSSTSSTSPEELNFNLGALLALEKACSTAAAYIFISEHSCEAQTPVAYSCYAKIIANGNPHRISLCGHDEYTIKFSHLSAVATAHGYRVQRGAMADILPFRLDQKWQALLRRHPQNDEEEILQHFFSDLFQYEYLLLIRDGSGQKHE